MLAMTETVRRNNHMEAREQREKRAERTCPASIANSITGTIFLGHAPSDLKLYH